MEGEYDMTIKKVAAIMFLLLFIAAAVGLGYHYFHTSKQVYEGVLVYREQNRDSAFYEQI